MVIGSDPHPVSLTWNIFVVFSSLFSAFVLYLVYTIVIRPYVKMGFYRKQGISCYFFPLIGRLRLIRDSFKKYGDTNHFAKVKSRTNPERISCSNLGTEVALSLHDTALIKEFYLNNDNYEKAPILFAIYKPLLGRGLITSEGNQWKKQRKILSNAFHFEFLKSILPGIQDTAHQNLLRLHRESLQKVNMKEELQRITGEVIGKMFFGEQLNDYKYQNKPLTLALADIIIEVAQVSLSPIRHLLGPYLVTKGILPRHKRLMHNVKAFRQICSDIIEERKRSYEKEGAQQDKKKDMLDLLLQNSGEEGRLSDIEIIDQFVTFFLAGMDTTGHLINMTIYFLHKYPEYKEQMLEEIKRIYHPKKETTIEELNKMEFTMAFIKETLRFMTPVPGLFPRKAIKDHQIKDISIKAGTVVSMSFFYNHYNPVFFEDPDTFDPKRWLNKEKLSDAYSFVPFSAGPRNCIGQHLALIEARIILAEFLTMYDFELPKGYQLKMGIKFLYDPVEDILLDLTPKKQE